MSPFGHYLISQDKYPIIQNPFLSKKKSILLKETIHYQQLSGGKIYLRHYWKKNRPPLSSEFKFKVALLHVAQLLQLLSLMSLQPLYPFRHLDRWALDYYCFIYMYHKPIVFIGQKYYFYMEQPNFGQKISLRPPNKSINRRSVSEKSGITLSI